MKKAASPCRGGSELRMYNTNTHNKNKLLLLATGIRYHLTAALNQMGNSHSSSALSHIPTPASPQTPRLASQPKGSGASGQRSQIPPSVPAADAIPPGKDGGIFGVERREAGSRGLSDAALGKP